MDDQTLEGFSDVQLACELLDFSGHELGQILIALRNQRDDYAERIQDENETETKAFETLVEEYQTIIEKLSAR